MGQALSSRDCFRQAQEFLTLAQSASDADLRNKYIKLATEMRELAGKLDTWEPNGSERPDFSPSGEESAELDERNKQK